MYRIVTIKHDHRGNKIIETGPWTSSWQEAESWAEALRELDYKVCLETVRDGNIVAYHDNADLAIALANMRD